jgi:hypothetical protein
VKRSDWIVVDELAEKILKAAPGFSVSLQTGRYQLFKPVRIDTVHLLPLSSTAKPLVGADSHPKGSYLSRPRYYSQILGLR